MYCSWALPPRISFYVKVMRHRREEMQMRSVEVILERTKGARSAEERQHVRSDQIYVPPADLKTTCQHLHFLPTSRSFQTFHPVVPRVLISWAESELMWCFISQSNVTDLWNSSSPETPSTDWEVRRGSGTNQSSIPPLHVSPSVWLYLILQSKPETQVLKK
jgi:hypothetical protein